MHHLPLDQTTYPLVSPVLLVAYLNHKLSASRNDVAASDKSKPTSNLVDLAN